MARLITEVGTSLWRLALQGENERERRAACEFLLARRGGPAWKEHSSQAIDLTVQHNAHATLAAKLERLSAQAALPAARPSPEPSNVRAGETATPGVVVVPL